MGFLRWLKLFSIVFSQPVILFSKRTQPLSQLQLASKAPPQQAQAAWEWLESQKVTFQPVDKVDQAIVLCSQLDLVLLQRLYSNSLVYRDCIAA